MKKLFYFIIACLISFYALPAAITCPKPSQINMDNSWNKLCPPELTKQKCRNELVNYSTRHLFYYEMQKSKKQIQNYDALGPTCDNNPIFKFSVCRVTMQTYFSANVDGMDWAGTEVLHQGSAINRISANKNDNNLPVVLPNSLYICFYPNHIILTAWIRKNRN